MLTRNQKILIALIAVAVFAVAVTPITTFAQETPDSSDAQDHSSDKYDGNAKSCPGKHKGAMTT
jgi:hypothetical protein